MHLRHLVCFVKYLNYSKEKKNIAQCELLASTTIPQPTCYLCPTCITKLITKLIHSAGSKESGQQVHTLISSMKYKLQLLLFFIIRESSWGLYIFLNTIFHQSIQQPHNGRQFW